MPFIVSTARPRQRAHAGPLSPPTAPRPSVSPPAPWIARRSRSSFTPPPPAATADRRHRRTSDTRCSMWHADDIDQICVVGGGNAAQALAALLSHAYATGVSRARVSVLAPFGDESARLSASVEANGGITVENPDGGVVRGRPDLITADAAAAVRDARVVLLPLPTFAMPSMLRLIAPHLGDGCWVGGLPAQGGFQWMAAEILKVGEGEKEVKVFGLDKLPFNCRTVEYGKLIKVFGYKEELALAAIPNRAGVTGRMAETLSQVIPRVRLYPVSNFLVLTLATSNQCIHPARMYGMFSQGTVIDHVPLFYEEMDDLSAHLIHQVSEETLAIARAVEAKSKQLGHSMDLSSVMSVAESTTKVYEVGDTSSLKRIFQTCAGFAGIGTPLKKAHVQDGVQMYQVDWKCRYFTEDIPALCVLRGLAELLGVDTGTIDMLIKWAQKDMDGAYEFITKDDVLNTDRKKLMYTPQYWGILDAEALVGFHA